MMKSALKNIAVVLVIGITSTACSGEPRGAQINEPIVLATEQRDGKVVPVGWIDGDQAGEFQYYMVPTDPALEGSRLIQAEAATENLADTLQRALEFDGFSTIQIAATTAVKNTPALDPQGKGAAFVGTAEMSGDTYRFAAVGLYGSLDERPRHTTQYVFVAPERAYIRMGGWAAVSQAWFELDGAKVQGNFIETAQSDASDQADGLALATDYYIAKVAQLMSLFITNLQMTTRQILDQQCTGVSGTGPDAYGVSGLGNPDC